MSSNAQNDCVTVIATSCALIDQFQQSLNVPKVSTDEAAKSGDYPSPLLLFKAAAESVKQTTTKLSLLSITVPFTGSAITSLVKPLNDSILPSLVTAALLVTPSQYPDSFATEACSLAKAALGELKVLLELVLRRAKDGKPKAEPGKHDKQSFTEATGKVWENCDSIVKFATDGVPGFVVRKAEQWLALMKDAVEELQEWDPEEDVDDIFGDVASDDEGENKFTDKENDHGQATIATGVKEQALKVLSRIPQSIHVVVKQRLAKMPAALIDEACPANSKHKEMLNHIIRDVRLISECIDESAEAMYMGNPELCLKKAGEARAVTINVVNSVIPPWEGTSTEATQTKEDTFVNRALLWIQQVDTSGNTISAAKDSSKS